MTRTLRFAAGLAVVIVFVIAWAAVVGTAELTVR